MTILLDTHVLYWWITGEGYLSTAQRQVLGDASQRILVSAVTGWEIAIKVKIGKWPGAAALVPRLEEAILAEGFSFLDLTLSQAKRAGSLDLVHRDPFDRMLAAQALDLDLTVATVDRAFAVLGCKVV